MEEGEGVAGAAEAPAGSKGRDLKVAIATGLLLAAIVLGTLWWSAAAFFAFAFLVLMIAQVEFLAALRKAGYRPATALGLTAGAVLMVGAFARGEGAGPLVFFLLLVFSFIWFLRTTPTNAVRDISVTIFSVAYVPLLGAFAGLLLTREDGRAVMIAAIGATVLYDVFAFAFGSLVGKRPLAPTISPNKTIEGALIATVLLALVGPPIIVWLELGPWDYLQSLVFIGMVAIAAPVGDLFESVVKRDLGIKDMGAIFPGHGGALDRVDAILFVAPITYLSLRLFGL